jgi:glycosyltransferase involved in cell wall biosynthesis
MSTLALCIPAYNAGSYLPRLLQSAKNQAILFDEILVYNDASTDNTVEIAEQYGAKVITGDVNRGCSYGKNILANAAASDWIHFHDADDDLLPEFSKEVHKWISDFGDSFEVLLLNFKYVDFESGDLLTTANHDAAELHSDPLKYAINNKIVNFGVYKLKSFLAAGGFDLDENVLYNEDNAFHQRLAKERLRFDYHPVVTCINFRYKASMSASNQLKCAKANYHVLAKTASTHGNAYPLELSEQLWHCIAGLAAGQDWDYVKKALALSKKLGYKDAPVGDYLFKNFTKINPFLAVWVREKMIRIFKPRLRKNEI